MGGVSLNPVDVLLSDDVCCVGLFDHLPLPLPFAGGPVSGKQLVHAVGAVLTEHGGEDF